MSAGVFPPLDLQQIFDATPGLLLVLAPDSPRFTILAATDAYLQATHKQRSEILGLALIEAFPDNPDNPEPQATRDTRASLDRALALRLVDTMAMQRHHSVRPAAQGGGIETRYWRPVNTPVINASGEVAYLIHRVEDATEAVRLAQQAAEQQALADARASDAEALQAANSSLRDSRRAALNLMQDAVAARQQAEAASAALRESEAQARQRQAELKTMMATIPAPVFIAHDAAGELITGNPAALALLRLPPGRNPGDSAAEGERPAYEVWGAGRRLAPQERPLQRAAASGRAVSGAEFDIVFPGGEVRHIIGDALPLFDDTGAVRGSVGSFIDITANKRRERNLGFLADLQKVFTPLISAADSMRVASQRIADLLQLNHCVLAEIDEAAHTATVLHDHHAADAVSLVGVYRIEDFLDPAERQELAAGRTVVIADVRSDGRTTQKIDRFAALGVAALVEAPYMVDGRLKFVLGALRGQPHAWAPEDVELLTELAARLSVRVDRARAEERLVASEERMRRAAEAARFGVYDRELHGAHFHISVQIKQMLGYAPDAQLDHRQVMSHFHPDDRAAGRAAYRRACSPGGDGRIEIEQRIVRRDGVVRWVATVGQLLFKDGVPLRSIGFWVDISERKEAEAVLRRRDEELRAAAEVALASKYKSEFLANMSHELRTPLNSLLILSKLRADNNDRNLTPKQVEFAQVMHQSGSDLLRLINEILDLSRIEAGQVEVYVEAIGLAKLGEKIERDFRHVAQSRQLDFEVSLDPQLPALIRSDANRLEQVLKNLLANSFKFTEKGSVKLAIHRAADGWSRPHASLDQAEGVIAFSVADSGIGIAPEQHQLIFDAFAQVDGTISRRYGGTGLGLSISRELASLLGGAIVLTSEAGVGSTFTLYLPFTYSATSAARHPKAEPTGRQAMAAAPPIAVHGPVEDDRQAIVAGDEVVLIVEYDPVFARLLLEIAQRHAFKGLVATTAAAALQLARQHQPAAITLSLTLPDMDGWTLLQRVNDDLGLRHIPVHIVSGEDERPRGLRQGAASCLQKPASEAELGALFERIRAAKARTQSLLLVVEDDPAMQRQIVQTLGESADVETTLAASAEQGLAALKARRYDCVVLDLRLPGMSGYEFLEAVRDELRIDDLPIVVYTGTDLSAQQRARLRQLAESVLVKDARSLHRLLDQTSLYLHRRVSAIPQPARATLERLHADTHLLAGTKVLVVDDDMRNVFALFAILENEGIEAKHAEDGIQCLDILATTAGFDAVLMDIMMPGMDGYEAMRRIRKMKGFEALPVIALTAKAMQGDREKCIDAGASDYLTKPVDRERLLALLRYWICP